MRRTHRFLPLLALLASGCERMPEDPVFLYGTLLRQDGSPRAGATLHVDRALSFSSDLPTGTPTATEFAPYTQGTSEGSGDFTLEVLHGDIVEESFYAYDQYRFRVYPPLEEGHGVFVTFTFNDDVELPALRPWDSRLAVSDGSHGPALTFAPAPPPPESPPSAELPRYMDEFGTEHIIVSTTPEPVVQLHGEGGLVWQQQHAVSPWQPSPELLEDFAGVEAQVRALTVGSWYFQPLASNSSDLTFRQEWRSPRLPLPAGALRPVSRGASCSPVPEGTEVCPYTDGKLARVGTRKYANDNVDPGPGNIGEETLTFTLAAPARLRKAVVRGLNTTLTYLPRIRLVLEGSADGASWTTLADAPVDYFDPLDQQRNIFGFLMSGAQEDSPFDGPLLVDNAPVWLEVPLTGDAPVRYVRMTARTPQEGVAGRLVSMSELSLFE